MYIDVAGAPTSVNEQLAKQETTCRMAPDIRTKPMRQVVFWFVRSEVHEAEAAELPELGPVSFLRIQPIAITLDGELVGWFR